MKWDEKTIPSTVNHTHMKGWGGSGQPLLFYLNFTILYTFQTNNSSNHDVLVTRHQIRA